MALSTIQASASDARSAAAAATLDQPVRGVGPAAQQVEHQPPRRREEHRSRRLLAEPLEGAHLPVHRRDVERLAGHLQAPEVRLQPDIRVEDVGRDVVQPRASS